MRLSVCVGRWPTLVKIHQWPALAGCMQIVGWPRSAPALFGSCGPRSPGGVRALVSVDRRLTYSSKRITAQQA
eukprot:12169230-Alexandrium_andersonii.AAC.1